MGYTVPTTEPTALRAGDTWQWRREDLSDYPASAWTLKYYFRNASAFFDVTAAADGNAFAVSVPKATTAGYTVGDYDWVAVVESATERYQIDAGLLAVERNLATAAAYDARSFARTMLDAVEAALTAKATSQQLDLVQAALADRSMQYNPAALMTLRSQLKNEVKREQAAQNGTDDRRLLVRFG
jgi:hypothetical protein